MIGQLLGHYRIESKLGAGGMGVVYRAHDTHLGRSVAIKILPPESLASADRKRRFIREAKAASALTHPNIITIHDADTLSPDGSSADPIEFIVMEYIEGRSLDQLIARGPLSLDDVLDYSVQITSALAAAHGAGIIHRDIKPANIMVTESGHVKILDFGLAKLIEPLKSDPSAPTLTQTKTETGVIMGSVAYMSPEQGDGQALDARTDVFSFGVVLYEMLTQQRPFRGNSALSILNAIIHKDPTPLKKLRPEVSPELRRIVSRCLEKDRTARYPSAADLKTDLVACRSASSLRLSSVLRKPRFAIPAVLTILAIALAAGWFIRKTSNERWAYNTALPEIARLLKDGTSKVGSNNALSPYGSFDMAGNVREWTINATDSNPSKRHYILGASWNQAPYMFTHVDAEDPFDRSERNGFRCAKFGAPLSAQLTAPIESESRDYTKERPVSDETFAIYRGLYSYEKKDLNVRTEAVDESGPFWRKETVSFDAGYPGERVIAHLLIPRNVSPPYQTVIYFPSSLGLIAKSSDDLELMLVDFLPRIGRAVLYPVYKGMYERHFDTPPYPLLPGKDLVIAWSRDVSRSIDYLETRRDIDLQKLSYYSYSMPFGSVMSALDDRIKTTFHVATGLPPLKVPPEYDPLNFAPRVKAPTLLIGGRLDFLLPLQTCQMPLLNALGPHEKDKRLAVFERGHVVWLGPDVIKEIVQWLDRYLGPVKYG